MELLMEIKSILQSAWFLFLRLILVCILCFMTIPLASFAPAILTPLLGFFYGFVLLYFFIFTMWSVGKKDTNLVKTGLSKENLAKGFLAAGILAVILFILVLIPSFFPQDYTGTVAVVFNFIKFALSLCINYLVIFFFGNASLYGTVIVFGIAMIICTASAGIAYIVGYKNIPLIEPLIQKIKKIGK